VSSPDTLDCTPAEAHRRHVGATYLGIAVRVALGSAITGLAVSVIDPTMDGLVANVIYSECIGLAVFAIYVALRWRSRPAPRWAFRDHLIRGAIAIPLGFFIGVNAASLLTGHGVGLQVFSHVAPFAYVVTGACSVAFIYFFWLRNRLAEAAAANADALRMTAEARLKLLQTQIEPHMLFNTLANLRTLVEIDPQRAQTMIDELIVYLRATLAASRNPTATLADEFTQLRAYLELMKVRMAHRLEYELVLPDALRDASIPPMLLQPLVENAIKHGLEPNIDGGTVRVVVTGDARRLDIEVADDGVGLGVAAPDEGYGLVHVRERLKTLHDDAATMTIGAGPTGGVVVRLSLPR